VENHVGLVFNGKWVGALQADALMAGGLDGLRQIAFPFNAKVMAGGTEAREADAVGGVGDSGEVRGGLGQWQVITDAIKIVSKFGGLAALAGICFLCPLHHGTFVELCEPEEGAGLGGG
jgi:hypothetical protein